VDGVCVGPAVLGGVDELLVATEQLVGPLAEREPVVAVDRGPFRDQVQRYRDGDVHRVRPSRGAGDRAGGPFHVGVGHLENGERAVGRRRGVAGGREVVAALEPGDVGGTVEPGRHQRRVHPAGEGNRRRAVDAGEGRRERLDDGLARPVLVGERPGPVPVVGRAGPGVTRERPDTVGEQARVGRCGDVARRHRLRARKFGRVERPPVGRVGLDEQGEPAEDVPDVGRVAVGV
jgi:hypothetical protein